MMDTIVFIERDPDYISHYGVKGMKWGVRHDPERVGRKRKKKNKGLSDKTKRRIKIGAAAVGGVLLAYGAYKLTTSSNTYKKIQLLYGNPDPNSALEKSRSIIDSLTKENVGVTKQNVNKDLKSAILSATNNKNVGKELKDIDASLLKTINDGIVGFEQAPDPERSMNCGHTSVSYIMNSLFGVKCQASPMGGVDEKSGMLLVGRTPESVASAFDNVKITHLGQKNSDDILADYKTNLTDLPLLKNAKKSIPKGSTGILEVSNRSGSHFLNYERSRRGKITLIDTQNNLIGDGADDLFNSNYVLAKVFDFSNASLKPNAYDILKYFVQ